MQRILLVEDNQAIVENLEVFLQTEGFLTLSTARQDEALEILSDCTIDLVLLDLTLAEGSGFSLCAEIKAKWSIPIIILTANSDEFSTVACFDLGADDYVTKPFRPRVLLSRIKNCLRRTNDSQLIHVGDLSIDTERAIVRKQEEEIFLSAMEYKLLLTFLNSRQKVLTRDNLLEEIWSISGEFVNDNTLSVYIKRLRQKIEDDPNEPQYIRTVRGLGYIFKF